MVIDLDLGMEFDLALKDRDSDLVLLQVWVGAQVLTLDLEVDMELTLDLDVDIEPTLDLEQDMELTLDLVLQKVVVGLLVLDV